ncbi:hypothetical protein AA958_08405 [Streptomyces sp. CNQ-509]|uniref:DUF6454 family protein n=1 Tax=unclassified Streptomyces TaxID=2593676 RepID=UPI00062E02E7|nr:DUF6454 family protein [Streptomyces sp. CNQ-509]AKH82250.1 hypothetical protein AA958_08405 [Streptomyces sp. CNQ-509]
MRYVRTLGVTALAAALLGTVAASAAPAARPGGGHGTERDAPVVEAVAKLDRNSKWELVEKLPLDFETYHPQGMTRVGDRLFLSSVEVIEPPVRYPEPVDGYDRSPGRGVGHLFVLDLKGRLLEDLTLGEGDMYHPGGIDTDGRSVWVPVAEYRPDSAAVVYRVDVRTLKVTEEFRVDDHIGGVVPEPRTGKVHGVSWGSRTFYTWDRHGRQMQRRPNQSHFVDYQDCAYADSRKMLCTGITGFKNASGADFELGGIAAIDLRTFGIEHEVPVQLWSTGGHVATRNPVHLEALRGEGLRMWAAPDDGASPAGTELLVYETRPAS